MEKIASFKIDHTKLLKGMYISRVDGDVITYDVRMKIPNGDDYLSNGTMHTFEHLFATYARNSQFKDYVIYVGPMGCRTGFYLLMRDTVSVGDTIKMVKEAFEFISNFEGKIPGTDPIECGNYKEHDLDGAKEAAKDMLRVLENWTEKDINY
ncbi:MAG: S-ribosylhomocysteine lyase [Acutalibacteraceae bacterium]|nr:S-ribosylhomocysteine lyase [Acutalibacteraceae bacterium]